MIKFIKKIIRTLLLKFNINIYLFTKEKEIIDFVKLFKIKLPKKLNLIRIGSSNDGGYLVPNILSEISFCYSAGIGKNIDFEKDLLNHNIVVFGADGNIDKLPEDIKNYNFTNKNIGLINNEKNIRFETWINSNENNDDSLIGQIDIEGAEYNLILDTPINIFKKFKIIVIEFHNLSKIDGKIIYDLYFKSLEKLLTTFNICHIHLNNAEKPIKIKGINIPPLIEVTFLRKDLYKGDLKKIEIPNKLDAKNLSTKENFHFDENWIKIIN